MRWAIRCTAPGCGWESEAEDETVAAIWRDLHHSTAPGHAAVIAAETSDGGPSANAGDRDGGPGVAEAPSAVAVLPALDGRHEARAPLPSAPAPAPGPEPLPQAPVPMQRRLLIVDDDPMVRDALRQSLQCAGYEVSEAVDGDSALAQVRLRPPQVILLDVRMPGLDGYDVCERLHTLPGSGQIPVILVTAAVDLDLHRRACAVGASACIKKPIRMAALVGIIEAALATAAQRGKATPRGPALAAAV